VRRDSRALCTIPDRTELPLDEHALGVIASLWREFPLCYDWNPMRIAWRDHQRRYRVTRFGGFVVLGCPAPEAGGSSYLLWGRGNAEDLSAAMTGQTMLRADRATAEHAASVGTDNVAIFPARNFDEYFYDLAEQHGLQGKKFGRRRTYLRFLQRSAGSVEFVELDLGSHGDLRAISDVYAEWERNHGTEASIEDERAALQVMLSGGRMDRRTRVAGLRISGELAGFAVYDLLNDSVATAHFVKAWRDSATVAGTWHALFTSAYRVGATVLNGGYDAGLEGLRAAKGGLRPHEMREAFFVLSR
jgi:hypothetical protein